MERHKVFRSDRIKVTEDILSQEIINKNILEIGAGDYSFEYLKSYSSWVKVDFSEPCDVICDFNVENMTLPFHSESFDLIICTEVLEHLLWPQNLLKECHRVLSAEGKILISVPNIVSLTYRISWLLGRIPSCAASGNIPLEIGSTAYRKENGHLIGGHVIDFNLQKIIKIIELSKFEAKIKKGTGIIWHRQILPHWLVPVSWSSNIIILASKK